MINCQHCGTKLLKNAKYCHACGEEVILNLEACKSCSTLNPVTASFCVGCGEGLKESGENQSNKKRKSTYSHKDSHAKDNVNEEEPIYEKATPIPYKPIFTVSLGDEEELQEETKKYFFQALRTIVKEVSTEKKYSEYVQTFYDSGFNFYFSQLQKQLIRDLQRVPYLYPQNINYQVDTLIDNTFESLLNRFITTHTRELNDWQPPDVLRWELIKKEDLNVEKMIFDYLDLPPNEEKIYTNFLTMPVPKLKNAWKSFLKAGQSEMPLIISDQSMFGSCKEGFSITNKGIYWKAHFNKPKRFYFDELVDIRRVEDWININGSYFHANDKMNYKMLRLLKKLRAVYVN
jgi:hypothetical protein